jgi:YceI-like domain
MKKVLFIAILSSVSFFTQAQKYFTKDGSIKFFSDAKMEKIQATNNKATCVIDAATGDMQWSVLIKGFVFENAFMGEHFNETYMESDKFDKSTFKGKIDNISAVNFKADGTYKVKVSGAMTMHGVTKNITVDGTITVKGGAITSDSKFYVKPSDYGIVIPGDKADTISNNIEITVKSNLQELKK